MRGADLSVVSSPESRCTSVGRANKNSVGPPDGSLDLWSSRWFSLELKRESWPWVYEKSDKPSLLISTLEHSRCCSV